MFDGPGTKRKTPEEADLDITPMIDVTFLLLIFFMVTSTMQATPDKDIPPSKSGENANMAAMVDVTVKTPKSTTADGDILLDSKAVNLEQLKAGLLQKSASGKLDIMVFAERDVRNGFVSEVEKIIGEVKQESGVEVRMNFAVSDRQ